MTLTPNPERSGKRKFALAEVGSVLGGVVGSCLSAFTWCATAGAVAYGFAHAVGADFRDGLTVAFLGAVGFGVRHVFVDGRPALLPVTRRAVRRRPGGEREFRGALALTPVNLDGSWCWLRLVLVESKSYGWGFEDTFVHRPGGRSLLPSLGARLP